MRINEQVSLGVQTQAAEVVLTTVEGREIRLRANDICGVEAQLTDPLSPIFGGERCRVHLAVRFFDIRGSAAATLALVNTAVTALALSTVHVQDQKVSGTDGGTATSGSFQTRDLNTIVSDPGSLATLVANQLTLVPGAYIVLALCPAQSVNGHQARLQNIDLGTTTVLGETGRTAGNHMTPSFIQGTFTIAVATTFEIQHRVASTQISTGFGAASGFAGISEIYTSVRFGRIA